MKLIITAEEAGGEELMRFLEDGLDASWTISVRPSGADAAGADLVVMLLDARGEDFTVPEGPGAVPADVVLVDVSPRSGGRREISLEAALKGSTGAKKVLLLEDEKDRRRAYGKVLDLALARDEGGKMPEDIPEEVLEAVRKEAVDGRLACARAQALAGELGVPIPLVGRALDLLDIKITECQLGCF
jgi:hypothetical protein